MMLVDEGPIKDCPEKCKYRKYSETLGIWQCHYPFKTVMEALHCEEYHHMMEE